MLVPSGIHNEIKMPWKVICNQETNLQMDNTNHSKNSNQQNRLNLKQGRKCNEHYIICL